MEVKKMKKLKDVPEEKKTAVKKRGRHYSDMNYSNKVYERAEEIDPLSTVGASAMGFPKEISPVRGVMATRHTAQRVVLDDPEFAYLFTGAENPFGVRSSFFHCADANYQIMKIFRKFKDFDISEVVYILRDIETGRYRCEIFEAGAHHNVEKYGFKMINNLANKHEGDYIAKGDVMQKSSSYDESNNYCGGVNARIMYTVLPEVSEDSITICESMAKRLAYNLVDIVKTPIGKNSFLLNTYGDDSLYKSFPNIGEEIKDDILCSIRENAYVSSMREAKSSHINDQDKIAHGIVVDIDVLSNVETDNVQVNYYKKCCEDYYNDIYAYVSTIVQDPLQDDTGLLDLYQRAEKYLFPAMWVTKENIVDNEIHFKIIRRIEAKPGQKIVGRYGNKSVISNIVPDELMPRTDDGRPIEIIANGLSINNRIIAFVLYESTITFMCERLTQHAHKMKENGATNDEIMAPIIEFCTMFNEEWGKEVDRLYREDPEKGIADILCNDGLKNRIHIHIPPFCKQCTRDAILEAYEKFGDIMKKYKIYTKLRHRWVPLKGEHAIGYQYIWVLKQEASKAMSAVSTGRTTLYDQPVKTKQFNKNNARRYSNNPIKFGEYDTYNFLAGVSVKDFAKITTYFRGSQYEENSILMTALNGTQLDLDKYNTFPQLDQLKNILKFFGEKLVPSSFGYGSVGTRDELKTVYFNNVAVDISVTELRHILIIYSYYQSYRRYCGGAVDMVQFYENMYNVDDLFVGYDMKYREYILHKFANMIGILDQLKVY